MRTLTAALTAAQKAASRTPVVKLEAHNKTCGVERYSFTRLYTGVEAEASHGAAIAPDGSFCRARLLGGTIWYQHVATPGPSSDYTAWSNRLIATAHPIAMTADADAVYIYYLQSGPDQVRRLKSTDNGVTYSDELVLATPVALAAGHRLAAAVSPAGKSVVFYILGTNAVLYWSYWDGAAWTAWANQTISTVEAGVVFTEAASCGPSDEADFPLALGGADAAGVGDRKIWLSAWNWTSHAAAAGVPVTAVPAGSAYTLTRPFLADVDGVIHIWYVQGFTGVTAYDRVFHSWAVPGAAWSENLTTEPDPFNHQCTEGLCPAVAASYVWLEYPSGVWRATRTVATVDLSADLLRLKMSEDGQGGEIVAELDNSLAAYASPGSGSLAALTLGCELRLGMGYRTTSGEEYVWTHYFQVDRLAHTSAPGRAALVLAGSLPRARLSHWTGRSPLRWNATGAGNDVASMLQQLCARAGIYLDVTAKSATADTFFPDFTIYPGQHGDSALGILLKLVPDVVRSDLAAAETVNPQAADASVYAYGTDHAILEGEYSSRAPLVTRVRAEGRNAGAVVLEDTFDFPGIGQVSDRLAYVFDLNIDAAAEAQERGAAYLRDAAIAGTSGYIVVPANVGQQLYDVVAITDARAGLSAAKRRVVGLRLSYDARKNVYAHTLALGAP